MPLAYPTPEVPPNQMEAQAVAPAAYSLADLNGLSFVPTPRMPAAADSTVLAPACFAALMIALMTLAAEALTMSPSMPAAVTLA